MTGERIGLTISLPHLLLLILSEVTLLPIESLAFPAANIGSQLTTPGNQRLVTQQPFPNYPPSHGALLTQSNNNNNNNNNNHYHHRSQQSPHYAQATKTPRTQPRVVIPVPRTYSPQVIVSNRPLSAQESQRHSGRDQYEPGPRAASPAPVPLPARVRSPNSKHGYADPFGDVKAMGQAQFSKSHLIHGQKKKKKNQKGRQNNTSRSNGRGKRRTTRMPEVHRYPTEPASQASQPIERYPQYTDTPDEGYLESLTSGADIFPDEISSDSEVTHFQSQPSNDYADEADPDYDEDGYDGDHDDDDDDDHSESRSKTFVASGTGPIPEDMRAYGDDDMTDPQEDAADALFADQERDSDRIIDYYKQNEQE